MSRSHRVISYSAAAVALWGLVFWLLAKRVSASAHIPGSSGATVKRLVGAGHFAALYRVTWASDASPMWNPPAEHDLISALPWKGIDEKSLANALRDPSAKVELVERKALRDGIQLGYEEKDNARHRLTSGLGWGDPTPLFRQVYPISFSNGYVQVATVNDNWSTTGHAHSTKHAHRIAPQQYVDDIHELLKLPNGKYERRVYVIAVS